MLFSQLKEEEKRSICKKEIENLENWLRRLAHELLNKEYGKNYLEYKDGNNNYLISRKIMQEVKIFDAGDTGDFWQKDKT